MKKLLYQKFLIDNLKIFTIISLSIGLIVWVIQAVGFLDFITEDGHGLLVYFYYTALNFPKIIHRIFPFVFFISLFYQIYQYEMRNELLIFWTHGVNKMNFVNTIVSYSILILVIQIFLGGTISPISQDKARSYIRNSNVDFFPSLIKEGKFIDTVSKLTIFIESKDSAGRYQNIFLNDALNSSKGIKGTKSQMIYAKNGILLDNGSYRYLELYNGRVVNRDGDKITNFKFQKINFDLSGYDSVTTTYPKIQEASSKDLFKCLYYNYKNKMQDFRADYLRCTNDSFKNIRQEFLKRFYKPIYIPLLALASCILVISSKESIHYNKFRIFLFIIIFLLIVISEISLRYSSATEMGLYFFYLFPILSFVFIYIYLFKKLNKI
jgi:lipopolysaccharide export system permease protein